MPASYLDLLISTCLNAPVIKQGIEPHDKRLL